MRAATVIAALLIGLLLSACGGSAASTPTQAGGISQQDAAATVTAATIARDARQTETAKSAPVATKPAEPTNTAPPLTETPAPPTSTSAPPTNTAALPTDTAVPPTEIAAAQGPGAVGDRVEVDGLAVTVKSIERAAEVGQFLKADPGNEFVIADVIIENAGTDSTSYNPLYFKIKDSEGFEYNASFVGPEPSLLSGHLAPGEFVRGKIAVEVKQEAKGLILRYQVITFGSGDPVQIDLEATAAEAAPDPAAPSTDGLPTVGDRAEASGLALTVNSVTKSPQAGDFLKADPGYTFVVADVTFENVGLDKISYNPLYFRVKDSRGFEYSASFTAPDPSFQSGELVKGDKVRGNLAIEVMEDSTGMVLAYTPITVEDLKPLRVYLGE